MRYIWRGKRGAIILEDLRRVDLCDRSKPPSVPSQVAALKNLGLNIKRAKLQRGDGGVRHKFFITDLHTSEKVHAISRLLELLHRREDVQSLVLLV